MFAQKKSNFKQKKTIHKGMAFKDRIIQTLMA
jgi:hypothetical protein